MNKKEVADALIRGAKGSDSHFITVVRSDLLIALGEPLPGEPEKAKKAKATPVEPPEGN